MAGIRFKVGYRALYAILYGVSLLPMWVLYRFSDVAYFLIRYVFKYRKAVITQNLEHSFPEKSPDEIRKIRNKFYLHLTDLIFETLKLISISDKELSRRMKFLSPEGVNLIRERQTGGIILASHFGNFEWANAGFDLVLGDIPGYSIYQRLKNPYFEKLMTYSRTKRGCKMIEKKEAFRLVIKQCKSLGLFGFMADQSPSRRTSLYFTRFLNQPTAMHEGFSILSIKKEIPVYYLDIKRLRRGYYSITLLPVDITPFFEKKDVHGLTDLYARLLEKTIQRNPAYWLWSHKRWKHEPKDGDVINF